MVIFLDSSSVNCFDHETRFEVSSVLSFTSLLLNSEYRVFDAGFVLALFGRAYGLYSPGRMWSPIAHRMNATLAWRPRSHCHVRPRYVGVLSSLNDLQSRKT